MLHHKIALLSVTCKKGDGYRDIARYAQALLANGYQKILASGGTRTYLKENGVPVTDSADFIASFVRGALREKGIEMPEKLERLLGKPWLDHRMATISSELFGALISNPNVAKHTDELTERFLEQIDHYCCDFYEFAQEVAREGATPESINEKRDIGGPSGVESAVKGERAVIADPDDRREFILWLEAGRPSEVDYIRALGAKAEFIAAKYNAQVAMYRGRGGYDFVAGMRIAQGKGENEIQGPYDFYDHGTNDLLAHSKFELLEGNPMGYVNRTDLDRLLQTMTHAAAAFELNYQKVPHLAFGVKHGNCCGGAYDWNSPVTAVKKMLEGDLQAVFGGFVMTNFPIEDECAQALVLHKLEPGVKGRLLDGIVTPAFTMKTWLGLASKSGRRRLIVNDALEKLGVSSLDQSPLRRGLRGGHLKQKNYTYVPRLHDENKELAVYGDFEANRHDLLLAWAICATSNSNTITLVKDGMLIGNGVGQQSRVRAARLALFNATDSGHDPKGSVAWSDSFFPFPDGPQKLIEGGVTAIGTTSGSQNDRLTVELCKEMGVSLLMIPDSVARGFFGHGV
jgi:phosphoribosylaminoimidazolecarboxamide formyltransferase / IMP cyclohydrolase